MNWDRIQRDWTQYQVRAKQHWGKLSNDDLSAMAGKREVLAGKIIEAYALSKEDAERQINEWQQSLDQPTVAAPVGVPAERATAAASRR
jgi:uncharacterized protein YjbJ (UPF0337 family)